MHRIPGEYRRERSTDDGPPDWRQVANECNESPRPPTGDEPQQRGNNALRHGSTLGVQLEDHKRHEGPDIGERHGYRDATDISTTRRRPCHRRAVHTRLLAHFGMPGGALGVLGAVPQRYGAGGWLDRSSRTSLRSARLRQASLNLARPCGSRPQPHTQRLRDGTSVSSRYAPSTLPGEPRSDSRCADDLPRTNPGEEPRPGVRPRNLTRESQDPWCPSAT